MALKAAAITIDRGLKSDIYTGPLTWRPQVWTRQLRPVQNNPCMKSGKFQLEKLSLCVAFP